MFGIQPKKIGTIVGEGSQLKGELNASGTVRIDGAMEGNVRADWVIVGESGTIRGDVASRGVVVGGRVEGNIDAAEIVELKRKARVSGEIRTEKLVVSEGATFDGRSRMKRDPDQAEESDARVIPLKPPAIPS